MWTNMYRQTYILLSFEYFKNMNRIHIIQCHVVVADSFDANILENTEPHKQHDTHFVIRYRKKTDVYFVV